ncbi:MAG TPA: hypothetical protein VF223_00335 [Trebonia sp.]
MAKLGVAWMDAASSGKPLSRRLPIIVSCSKTSTRSQNSTSIRISRTTKYEPPASARTLSPASAWAWYFLAYGIVWLYETGSTAGVPFACPPTVTFAPTCVLKSLKLHMKA